MLRRVQPWFLGDSAGGHRLPGPALGAALRQGSVGGSGYRRGSSGGGLLGHGSRHMFRALVCCWKINERKNGGIEWLESSQDQYCVTKLMISKSTYKCCGSDNISISCVPLW